MQNVVCALKDCSLCLPQSSEWPVIKSCWPSWPDSLGIPSPLSDPQDGKPDMGFKQWETFFGIIVLQFVGHPPSRYEI